ncbi:CCAAT/enhancer-binding protein zeta [Pelomyxa schiedti]|nr:CCAAT/enhancer-binding protein zeta [Pelomyxa schiedti]
MRKAVSPTSSTSSTKGVTGSKLKTARPSPQSLKTTTAPSSPKPAPKPKPLPGQKPTLTKPQSPKSSPHASPATLKQSPPQSKPTKKPAPNKSLGKGKTELGDDSSDGEVEEDETTGKALSHKSFDYGHDHEADDDIATDTSDDDDSDSGSDDDDLDPEYDAAFRTKSDSDDDEEEGEAGPVRGQKMPVKKTGAAGDDKRETQIDFDSIVGGGPGDAEDAEGASANVRHWWDDAPDASERSEERFPTASDLWSSVDTNASTSGDGDGDGDEDDDSGTAPPTRARESISQGNETESGMLDQEFLRKCAERATKALDEGRIQSEKELRRSGDTRWLQSLLSKDATRADKVSALALLVQQTPIFRISELEQIVAMTSKKGRVEARVSINAVSDLFVHTLTPPFPLRFFHEHKLSGEQVTDNHLMYWFFEDKVKRALRMFISALEAGSKDNVASHKAFVIRSAYSILSSHPFQEPALVAMMVNKLGDLSKRVCGHVVKQLLRIVKKNPATKDLLVCEVEQFVFRKNVTPQSQVYCFVFLSQVPLELDEEFLANKLLDIFCSFFSAATSDAGMKTKMLTCILRGIRNVLPLCNTERLREHVDVLFRLANTTSFHKSIQALYLIHQLQTTHHENMDRYYCVLYSRLQAFDMLQASKIGLFLQLLLRSMKEDESDARVCAFVQRILQISLYAKTPLIAGFLMLLREVFRVKRAVYTKMTEPSKVTEEEYDFKKRNPLYCHAENTLLWSLFYIRTHFHPSASKFASLLLDQEPFTYQGNPLIDFSLMSFLDKFSSKNPKKKALEAAKGRTAVPGTSNMALRTPKSTNTDEKFFEEFYAIKTARKPLTQRSSKKDDKGKKPTKAKKEKGELDATEIGEEEPEEDEEGLEEGDFDEEDEEDGKGNPLDHVFDDIDSDELDEIDDEDKTPVSKSFVDADEFARLLEEGVTKSTKENRATGKAPSKKLKAKMQALEELRQGSADFADSESGGPTTVVVSRKRKPTSPASVSASTPHKKGSPAPKRHRG